LTALPSDPVAAKYLAKLIPENSCWSWDADGLVRLDNRIYTPNSNDLWLCILRHKHNHPSLDTLGETEPWTWSAESIPGWVSEPL
jgi:hypothetical protein